MKLQQVIAFGLGLAVFLVPKAASAHTRAVDESTLGQLFHHLLHAAQQHGASAAVAAGLIVLLLLHLWQRGNRS